MLRFDYGRSNKRWRRLRAQVLREQPLCQESLRFGVPVSATIVHHIWPAEDYPEYAYCRWNLISLSTAQHNEMHDRVTGTLTAKGERWRRNTPPPL